MRSVAVDCDQCGCALTLDLKSEKADGGFHSCDIEYELKECGWIVKDGKDICDICKPPTDEELQSAHTRRG